MKHLLNEKITKLTRQALAFLLAVVLMTSAFVPGLTARATEDATDPSVLVLGEANTEVTEAPSEEATEAPNTEEPTEAPAEDPTEVSTEAPTEEPTEASTEAPTEEPTETSTEAPAEEETQPKEIVPVVVPPVIDISILSSSSASYNNAGASRSAGADGLILSKTTEPRGDGTFDLELTLKGSVGEEYSDQQIDVAIVIDRSASMNSENRLTTAKSAANNLIDILEANSAVSAMYNIIDFGGSANTKESDLIAGSTYGEPVAGASGWVAGSTAKSKVNQIDIHGGDKFSNYAGYNNQNATNYEAAIQILNGQMTGTRSGAMTAIIFLTDGKPTCSWTTIDPNRTYLRERPDARGYYYFPADYTFFNDYVMATDWYGVGTSYEGPSNTQLCLNVAMDDAANMKADMLFLLGTGTADLDMLRQLEAAAVNGGKVGIHEAELVASSGIAEKFASIAQKLNSFFYTNVGVTDILKHSSGELVVDLIGDASSVLVSVYDGNTKIAGPDVTVTLPATDNNGVATVSTAYDAATRQLDMVFPDSYKLEPTYTYKMTTVIRPTEKAYEMYRATGYDESGEPNTGSLSGQAGFHANDSATVFYNYSGIPNQEKAYAYPIVQLNPGSLVVTKNFEGLTQEQIDSLLDQMSFYVKVTYPLDASLNRDESRFDEYNFNLKDAKVVRSGNTFTWTIDKLSPGTAYTVTETGGELKDYNQTTSWTAPCEADCAENCTVHKGVVTAEENTAKTVSGIVDRSENVTVNYTNAYAIAATEITVEKQIVGNLGDWNKPFQFTASISNGTMNGIQYVKYNADGQAVGEQTTITSESFTFTLKDDEYITFTNIPLNSTFTISENPENYDLIEVKASESKDLTRDGNAAVLNVTGENKVTFTNELEASIETGVDLDSVPYVLILGAVAVCAFFFLRKRPVKE